MYFLRRTELCARQRSVRSGEDIKSAIKFMSRINGKLKQQGHLPIGRIHIVEAAMTAVPINEKAGNVKYYLILVFFYDTTHHTEWKRNPNQ